MKWKCEGHYQTRDIETAYITAIGQGIVYVVYSNAFWRSYPDGIVLWLVMEAVIDVYL